MKKTYIAGMLAMAFLSASCSGPEEKKISEISYQEDTVTVRDGSPVLAKLKLATVSTEPFCNEFRTVGTVQAESGRYAEIGVPFDGRILDSKVRIGSRVRTGQELFEISSPEFLEAGKEYFQSLRTFEKSEADFLRKQALQASGIVSQRELDEAYTDAENARRDKECAEATIKAYGMDPTNMTMGQPLTVSAPISGEIVSYNLTPGAYVKADSEPVMAIADLSRVWVTAQIKEHFIGSVSKGSTTEIYSDAAKGTQLFGEVLYVGNIVDEDTRSVQVIVGCDNRDGILKHGMFVSVHFMAEARESILAPSTAVFQGDGSSYVYVSLPQKGCFVRRRVVTGQESPKRDRILIEEGLEAGETILAEGGLYLND